MAGKSLAWPTFPPLLPLTSHLCHIHASLLLNIVFLSFLQPFSASTTTTSKESNFWLQFYGVAVFKVLFVHSSLTEQLNGRKVVIVATE